MFISVDLPAPFSPRSVCTSPRRSWKSTWSLATIPGKRFVIPRSSRTGTSLILDILRPCGGRRPRTRARRSAGRLLDRVGDVADRARRDLLLDLLHLVG